MVDGHGIVASGVGHGGCTDDVAQAVAFLYVAFHGPQGDGPYVAVVVGNRRALVVGARGPQKGHCQEHGQPAKVHIVFGAHSVCVNFKVQRYKEIKN